MRIAIALASVAGTAVLVVILLVTLILSPLFQAQEEQKAMMGADLVPTAASAALLLQSKVFGSRATLYDARDPLMQQAVLPYWEATCLNQDGSLCDLARSGNLNCVEFVTAVYALAGDPLPVHPDAETFWTAYAHRTGWQEIPSPSAFPAAARKDPLPGDMIVWKGGRHLEKQPDGTFKEVEYGHIGVIVSFSPPLGGRNGSIEAAESNAPGNKWPPLSLHPFVANDRPGNTYTMVVHPDSTIDTWGAYTDSASVPPVQYGAYSILGFIHQVSPQQAVVQQTGGYATSLPPGVTTQMPYVQESIDAAQQAGIPFGYFVRQIQLESGFHPRARSRAGAEGIAQLMPATAAALGIDPWNPAVALPAAARLMARLVANYEGDYAMALAAYNAGEGAVQAAQRQARNALQMGGAPLDWKTYLPTETQRYLQQIMGNR